MTILNAASDGLHAELIALARAVAHSGPIEKDDLIGLCSPGSIPRLRGALSRWTDLGLFLEVGGSIRLAEQLTPKRREALDNWTERLPHYCRMLVLQPTKCSPLWGDGEGVSADFVRAVAWLLAQDIFGFPTTWAEVEQLEQSQFRHGRIIQNDTRWTGLRFWARYLGFATGDSRSFLIDPTTAIRSELQSVVDGGGFMEAETFVSELARRIPVLDFGVYRKEVESELIKANWHGPAAGHVSPSLSFALRRLELDNLIAIESKADAAHGLSLTGKSHETLRSFTHIRVLDATKVSAAK